MSTSFWVLLCTGVAEAILATYGALWANKTHTPRKRRPHGW